MNTVDIILSLYVGKDIRKKSTIGRIPVKGESVYLVIKPGSKPTPFLVEKIYHFTDTEEGAVEAEINLSVNIEYDHSLIISTELRKRGWKEIESSPGTDRFI